MQRIFFRLDWRDYFRVTATQLKKNTREKNVEVYTKLYREIKSAIRTKMNEQMVALDPSTRTVLSISKNDFEEVLVECQKYLESAEEYEKCAEIRDTLEKLRQKPKRKTKVEKLILVKMK